MGVRFEKEKFEEYLETGTLILWYLDFTGAQERWPAIPETVKLAADRPTYVGRAVSQEECPITDPRISRRHAMLEITDKGLRITDLGSANGTYVNGTRITGSVDLVIGDQVNFDRIPFRVRRSLNVPELENEYENIQKSAGLARQRLIQARRERLASEGKLDERSPIDVRLVLARKGLERRMKSRYSAYMPVVSGSILAITLASSIIYLL